MKSLLLSLALLTSISASATTAVPKAELYNRIEKQATALGYNSYSQIVCLDEGGAVVVGGATAWPMGTEIFLVGRKGEITPTKRVSSREEALKSENVTLSFKAGDTDVSLSLGEAGRNGQPAFLTVGPSESPQKITCFSRISPLE